MKWRLGLLAAVLLAVGCEAPLNLEKVAAERNQAVHRFDHFKALAANHSTIVAAADAGVLVRSGRQQLDWERIELPTKASFFAVTVCPDGNFLALDSLRGLWSGDESGRHWRKIPLETEESMMSLACGPEGRIWVGGSFSTILRSSDSGKSWQVHSEDEDLYITVLQRLSDGTLIAGGEYGTVMRSSDQGENWERLNPIPNDFYPLALYFRDAQQGWVGGLNGTIWHTSDGGSSWTQENAATDRPLYQFIPHGGSLYAVGDNGALLIRKNQQWQVPSAGKLDVATYLIAGVSRDPAHLLLAGGSGLIKDLSVESEDKGEAQ